MKRIVRLTESDLTRIVRRVILEQGLNPTDLKTVNTILKPQINLAQCAKKYFDLGYKIVDKMDLPDGTYLHSEDAYPDLPTWEELWANEQTPDPTKEACAEIYRDPHIYVATLEGEPTGYIISIRGGRGCPRPSEEKGKIFVGNGRIGCTLNIFKKI